MANESISINGTNFESESRSTNRSKQILLCLPLACPTTQQEITYIDGNQQFWNSPATLLLAMDPYEIDYRDTNRHVW